MTIRAVLFDVGGPINTEIEHEQAIEDHIRALFAEMEVEITDDRYTGVWRRVVDSFAPNAYPVAIWEFAGGDDDLAAALYAKVAERSHAHSFFELREDIAELLAELKSRGLLLGIAANQPGSTIVRLEQFGVGRYFDSTAMSETLGYRKPDVRLFLDVCAKLGVAPEECIMVGDRIDCDIVPARQLGMRTVRLRTGRHEKQEPRSWHERPDAEVTDVAGMRAAIIGMLD